jgi:hypothetical protein
MKTEVNGATAKARAAERAARAIVALIKSRPSSPRQHEIEELIEKHVLEAVNPAPPTGSSLDEYGPDLSTYRS